MDIFDLVFPKSCLNCGKSGCYICRLCLEKIGKPKQICIICEKASIDGVTHIKCKKTWGMDSMFSIWKYEGVIRKAIIGLKYKFASSIAGEVAECASAHLTSYSILPKANYLLIPVPLHEFRKNWRGFNQAEEIGKRLSEKMGWEFSPSILIRKKLRMPQTMLKGKERLKNIQGVFSLNPNYQLPSTSFILFDDVATTGSTMREAGKVLKRNGAKAVWGLTIAR